MSEYDDVEGSSASEPTPEASAEASAGGADTVPSPIERVPAPEAAAPPAASDETSGQTPVEPAGGEGAVPEWTPPAGTALPPSRPEPATGPTPPVGAPPTGATPPIGTPPVGGAPGSVHSGAPAPYGTPPYGTPPYRTPSYGTPPYGTPQQAHPYDYPGGYPSGAGRDPAVLGAGSPDPAATPPYGGTTPPFGGGHYGGPLPGASGGGGGWGYLPWTPPGAWPPEPPTSTTSRRGHVVLVAALVAVLVAAFLGVVIGHAAWQPTSSSSSSSAPSGIGGGSSTPTTSPGPSDAASIASKVDPGLVDVDATLNYQDAEAFGTGMVLTSNGEVLTNNHVIDEATSISVIDIGNGKTYSATVVGYDRTNDVAVLQLKSASGLQTVTTGDSSKVTTGEEVVGIGNAGGRGGTPSYAGGTITALDQSITASDESDGTSEQLSGLIQDDADIQPGDSGGPLVNTSGQVLGMDTAASEGFSFSSSSSSSQGYAIPINQALDIAKQIESDTSTTGDIHVGATAFLGVEIDASSSSSGNSGGNGFGGGGFGGGGFGGSGFGGSGGSSSTSGAVIAAVISGSPAANAGLTAGDTITSLAGHAISSANDLTSVMVQESPTATVSVTYVNPSGQQQTTSVQLTSGPPQ